MLKSLYIIQQYSNKFQKMITKLKSLFSSQPNQETPPQKFNHPNMQDGDISQCPFMRNKIDGEQRSKKLDGPGKKPEEKKKKNNDSDDDSQQEDKPRGGCPFMLNSETKKNPNLSFNHQGYNEPFVSKYRYYLSSSKINFQAIQKSQPETPTKRTIFDTYPIYLKHTLFYNSQDYKKIRNFQCLSRFLAYQELREKGNKRYRKGKFGQALEYYQRAMSLFRWLDYREEKNKVGSRVMLDEISSQSQLSEDQNRSKIPIQLDEQTNGLKFANPDFDDFKQKYKEFFVIYHDDNVIYNNGDQLNQAVDDDLRKSLLIQLYLNMSVTYMKLNHFSLAQQILSDALKLSDKVSQIYLRKAQMALTNLSSSLDQLKEGHRCIRKAIEMQPNEKIFQNTNYNILKMCNIHDVKEVYAEVEQKLSVRIKQMEDKLNEVRMGMKDRLSEIYEVEKMIIKQGKIPKQNKDTYLFTEGNDNRILNRIYLKYLRIMQFYNEAKDRSQLGLAKRQFQQVLKTISEISFIESVDITIEGGKFGQDEEKIRNRIKNIKRQKCQDIYNGGRYNYQVLEWVITQMVKQDRELKKNKEEEQNKKMAKANQSIDVNKQKHNWMNKLPYIMIVIPVVGLVINYLI